MPDEIPAGWKTWPAECQDCGERESIVQNDDPEPDIVELGDAVICTNCNETGEIVVEHDGETWVRWSERDTDDEIDWLESVFDGDDPEEDE